jgi:hypothetical protein
MADDEVVKGLRRKISNPEFEKLIAQMRRRQEEECKRRLCAFWNSLTGPLFVINI